MLIDSLYMYLALLTQASALAGMLLLIFHLRVFFGLSPLYTVIGVLQPIQTILAGTLYFKLSETIIISPGSTILFTASLFAVLLVYIREDALETRKIVYSIVLANVIMAALLLLSSHQLTFANTLNPFAISPAIFNQGLRIILVGNVALFCDVILLILAYEWIRDKLKTGLFLSVLMTMLVVLAFDTLVFATGAFFSSPDYRQILLSGLIGKGIAALLFSLIFAIYLNVFEEGELETPQAVEAFRDIFGTLTYREKYHKERERSQTILRESDTLRRTIADSTSDALIAVDQKGTILDFNHAAETAFGYDKGQIIGKAGLQVVFDQEDLPVIEKRITAPMDSTGHGESGRLFNATAVRGDGSRFPVEIALAKVKVSGQFIVVLSVRDISTRLATEKHIKEAETRLHQAQKMESIGRLAGGIAHDFNNILSVINGYSELCLRQLEPRHHLYENLQAILSSGKKAASLVRKLLIFSRQQVLDKRLLDVPTTLWELDKMLRRLVRSDIEMVIDGQQQIWPIFFDQVQFEQIVLNLIVNSCDAMPNGGRLTLTTSTLTVSNQELIDNVCIPPGEYVLLSVGDTGHGMSKEIHDKIFEPFFTTKVAGQGTGMGLATVHGIIQQNGGHITFRSEPGQGTVFTIFLPKAKEDLTGQTLPDHGFLRELPAGTGTILVVEDDDIVRSFCREVLEGLGYSVLEASNGEEALGMFQDSRMSIDLVLTDIVMPKCKGHELADELLKLSPSLPIVIMSGYFDEQSTRSRSLQTGARILKKPFSHGELANSVHTLLASRRRHQTLVPRFLGIHGPLPLPR